MNTRQQELHQWINNHFNTEQLEINPIVGDCSFRNYFRASYNNDSFIIMDAPPGQEDCRPFIAIAETFLQLGIHVPHIITADLTQGFLLLSDFGNQLLLNELTEHNASELYQTALAVLLRIHSCQSIADWQLPHFDHAFIMQELQLFENWFLHQHLGVSLSTSMLSLLQKTYELLLQSAEEQPKVCVHRDYHSRNLMRLPNNAVGVLDFQDAVWGPVAYDAVSLLRDCYIDWPQHHVENWALEFHANLAEARIIKNIAGEQFLRWFDLIGLQRHLKVFGIFSRKKIRDNNPAYLQYFSRMFNYVFNVCDKYRELNELKIFLQDHL